MKIKFFTLILLTIVLLSPVKTNRVEKLFLVYMAADNNLYPQGMGDILEMERAEKKNVKVVALVDDKTGTRIEEITDKEEIIKIMKNEDSGDPETLFKFLNFSLSKYQAKKVILVLWGHGDGRNFKGLRGKGICFDETHSDFLTIREIENTLKRIKNKFNKKIDILIFDACFMQSIEVSYELRDYVDFVLGSQTYVPLDGIPYDEVISVISKESSDSMNLSMDIARVYFSSYDNGSQGNENVTFSVVDTKYTYKLKDFIKKIIPELIKNENILSFREKYTIPMNEKYIDLFSFMREVLDKKEFLEFDSIFKEVVKLNLNNFNDEFSGASIYFPPYFFPINLRFFTDSGWEELLWHKFTQ